MWGFPKIRHTMFRGLHERMIVFGVYIGIPFFLRKFPFVGFPLQGLLRGILGASTIAHEAMEKEVGRLGDSGGKVLQMRMVRSLALHEDRAECSLTGECPGLQLVQRHGERRPHLSGS